MTPPNVNIEELLEQRHPYIWVDTLEHCDGTETRTLYTVRNNGLYFKGDVVTVPGLLENVAQSCALRLAVLNRISPAGPRHHGVIGAVDNLEVHCTTTVGDTLRTTLHTVHEACGMSLIDARIDNITRRTPAMTCRIKTAITQQP